MDELGGVTDILRNKIAEAFLPVLNDMIDAIMRGDGVTQGLTGSVNELAKNNTLVSWFEAAGSNAAKFVDILNAVKEAVIAVGKTVGMLAIDINLATTAKDLMNPLMGMEERIKRTQELVAKFDARQAEWAKTKEQYNKDWLTWDVSNAYEKNASQRRLISGNSNNPLNELAGAGIAKMTAEANRSAAAQSLLTRETEKATKAKSKETRASIELTAEGLKIKSRGALAGGKTQQGTFALAHDIQKMLGRDLKYFSAFNDRYHKGTNSKHASGLALDVVLKDPKNSAAATKQIQEYLSSLGLSAGKDFRLIDEYKNPSGRATGGHIHAQFNSTAAAAKMAGIKGDSKSGLMAVNQDAYQDQQKLLSQSADYLASMYERIAMLGKETELQKLNAEIELGKYDAVEPERIKEMQQMAEKYDSAVKFNEQQERMNALIEEATGSEAVKSYYQDWEMLSQAFKDGKVNAEQYALALANLNANKPDALKTDFEKNWSSTKQWLDDANDVQARLDQGMAGWLQSGSDALAEFVTTGKLNFRDFTVSILQDLAKIAMQKAIAGIVGNIFGDVGGASLTGAVGFDSGGYTGDGGKFEPAGIVHKGEGVLNQSEIRALGGELGFNQLRRNIAGLRGHASGGMAGRPMLPKGLDNTGNQSIQMTNYITLESSGDSEADGVAIAEGLQKKMAEIADGRAQKQITTALRPGGDINNAIKGRN